MNNCIILCLLVAFLPALAVAESPARPNILILMAEDMSDRVGAFGDEVAVDGLADSTIVIWTTDHGDGLPRAKRDLFEAPGEERLFDLQEDPFELNNLAADPAHQQTLSEQSAAEMIVSGVEVEAKAIRYGWEESESLSKTVPQ